MRESLALNRPDTSSSSSESFDNEDENEEDSSDDERNLKIDVGTKHQPQALAPVVTSAAAASSNPSDKLYCVCQCPHDDVSEMIGCDNPDCTVEWFHFECMGIMIPPEGKWYCPECTKKYGRKIRK